VTVWLAVAVLPEASLAVQTTVLVPSGNPPAGALLVTTGLASQMSLTVGVPRLTGTARAVCSAETAAGAVIAGGVVSRTVTSTVSVPVN